MRGGYSVAYNGSNDLCEAHPEHVVQLGQLHNAIRMAPGRSPSHGNNSSISLEIPNEILYFLGSIALVYQIHEHQNEGSNECYQYPSNSYVGSQYLTQIQDSPFQFLEACFIGLLAAVGCQLLVLTCHPCYILLHEILVIRVLNRQLLV